MVSRPYTFTFVKTGGIAGVREELVVDSEGKRVVFRARRGERKTAKANASDLFALENALRKANFMNIHKPYRCGTCADQFIYEATLKIEGSPEHTVHWEDDSNAPAALTEIEALARRIVREKFETRR